MEAHPHRLPPVAACDPVRAAGATQELRALLLFSELPLGCVLHPVTDNRTTPHLRPGEFAIVDLHDREPAHGELFVIAYQSPLEDSGEVRKVVQTWNQRVRVLPEGQSAPLEAFRWYAAAYDRNGTVEGPYRPGGIEKALVGRIIGILAPTFDEPKRLTISNGGAV